MADDELTEIEARANAASRDQWHIGDPFLRRKVNLDNAIGIYRNGSTPIGACFDCKDSGEPIATGDYGDGPFHVHRSSRVIGPDDDYYPREQCIVTAGDGRAVVNLNGDCEPGDDQDRANCAFIAAARADVPRLVGEVRRLRADRDSAAAALTELQRTVATAVECLRADGSAGNVERVCGWLDVVKGGEGR